MWEIIKNICKSKAAAKPVRLVNVDPFTDGKKLISDDQCRNKKLMAYATTLAASAGCMMFGWRAGPVGLVMAACLSVIGFSLVVDHYRKHTKINLAINWVIILFILAFEMVCISAHFISDAKKFENGQVALERDRIQKEIDKENDSIMTQHQISAIKNKREQKDAAYNSALAKKNKSKLEGKMPSPIFSSEKDFYKKAADSLSVPQDFVEMLFNLCLGSLLVVANCIYVSQVNSYYCIKSLRLHVGMLTEEKEIMDSIMVTDETTATLPAVGKTGSVAPKDSQTMTIAEGYESAVKHVNEQIVGKVIVAKKLRDSTLQKTRDAQNEVLDLMKEKHVIDTQYSGSSPKYYHFGHTPDDKQQVNLRDSYAALKSVK
jgi:hypothetical protein